MYNDPGKPVERSEEQSFADLYPYSASEAYVSGIGLNGPVFGTTTSRLPGMPELSTPEAIDDWLDGMQRTMAEFKHKVVPWVCVPVYRGQAIPIHVRQLDVAIWKQGMNMPSVINDFERWWVAMLIRHNLVTQFYLINTRAWDVDNVPYRNITCVY